MIMMGNSLINLCFKINDIYKEIFIEKLNGNNLDEKDQRIILDKMKFDNEIIFSLNKEYKKGRNFDEFCKKEGLNELLPKLFKFNGKLYLHQEEAVSSIKNGQCTIISTGTGSGKTESFLIPIIDYCLKNKQKGIKAVIIYPMNALALDQVRRIATVVENTSIKFGIFNGETPSRKDGNKKGDKFNDNHIVYREDIIDELPDILITNYVMLDRILTDNEKNIMFIKSFNTMKFIVLDEIHTYRGSKGAHIKYLLQRLKSYFLEDITQVGCSATLATNKKGVKQDGYIKATNLDDFVCRIFNVKDYNFIEAKYEDNEDNSIYDKDYLELKNSKITCLLKEGLRGGSRSLNELLNLLKDKGLEISKDELKEHLIKIVNTNSKYPNAPILDFRIHLFMLELNSVLKRCIKCGKYQTTKNDTCIECGHPIFPVYNKDVTKCIGKIVDKKLKSDISVIEENEFWVLIENKKFKDEGKNFNFESLSFKEYYQIDDGIKLEYDREGPITLYFLGNIDSIEEHIITLNETNKPDLVYKLIKNTLMEVDEDYKKILTFIDNRERTARYSAILNDNFFSDLFYEIVKFVNNTEIHLNLADIYKQTIALLTEADLKDNELKNKILKEFHTWFIRAISISEDNKSDRVLPLYLLDDENLEADEKELLEIFLKEKAIKRENLKEKGQYIKFHLGNCKFKKAVKIDEITIEHPDYSILSLTKNGQKYRDFVENHDVSKLIDSLIRKGFLKCDDFKGLPKLYRLNPYKIGVKKEPSVYSSVLEIINEELFLAGVHNSEVDDDSRRRNEEDFIKGKLNVLVATSTLEMGIDIGSLNIVFMVGVPPMPSNYAQRAGRAGRRGNRFALIVTLCSEDNNHDYYYFNHPKGMVEGVITPPNFDDKNINIIKKHVNAFAIPYWSSYKFSNKTTIELNREIVKVFGDISISVSDEIESIVKLRDYNQNYLYEKGFYPDYSFNRDEVVAIDIEYKDKKGNEEDYELSRREPEQAYKQFVPGEEMFLGEDYYKFELDGEYVELGNYNEFPVLQFKKIYCSNKIFNINKKRQGHLFDTEIIIRPELTKCHDKLNNEEIISLYLEKNLPIYLINKGIEKQQGLQYNNKKFMLGYELKRDALLFEFDADVLDEEHIYSFCAAIDRTLKDMYGLDESEIGWFIEGKITNETIIQNDKSLNYAILYDKNGLGNVNLQRIFNDFMDVALRAYFTLKSCSCNKIGGCYICMKGYTNNRYAAYYNKNTGMILLGYLLGKNRFKPKIRTDFDFIGYDVEYEVKVDTMNKRILVKKGNQVVLNKPYFKSIFSELSEILKINIDTDVKTILIKSKQKFVVEGINGNREKEDEGYSRFNFYLLKYKAVRGEKI